VDFTALSLTYTILVIPKFLLEPADSQQEQEDEDDQEAQEEVRQPKFGGFSRTVRITNFSETPFTLKVEPLVRLPILDHPIVVE
jgi:hypothetical protein